MKVCHLTSVHGRDDIRIFRKQCRTLAHAGYEVVLIVADGKGNAETDGVRIVDVNRSTGGRISRMLNTTRRVLAAARAEQADLYQFHDPELLPAGLALRKEGRRVVFDSHEDFSADIRTKAYLHPAVRSSIAIGFSGFERIACRRMTHVIAATPAIRRHFLSIGCRSTDINNYPFAHELESGDDSRSSARSIVYAGGITSIRGFPEIVDAMQYADAGITLEIAGSFAEAGLEDRCRSSRGWARVQYHGQVGRNEVASLLARSFAGIVTFLPAPNHVDAQPNKMFEYMSAALPVIGSNFPLWQQIIEGNGCGICVDPENPKSIASAINELANNPQLVSQMGAAGRQAVLTKYNWEAESGRLLKLYDELVSQD
ncbi:glycosyltransferase family 4 protein [Aliihoeflea sp. PC F10.4]